MFVFFNLILFCAYLCVNILKSFSYGGIDPSVTCNFRISLYSLFLFLSGLPASDVLILLVKHFANSLIKTV